MSAVDRYATPAERSPVGIALRVTIVALTLATAYIHTTLGSMLFMANAVGYTILAIAMVVPIGIVTRYRWLVRAALLVFTAATIIGWFMFGPRFFLAYVDKGIEVGLIAALLTEMVLYDGGPINVVRRGIDLLITIVRYPFSGRSEA
jgi:hypothetical protein